MFCAIIVFLSLAILLCIYTLLTRLLLPSPRTLVEVADIIRPLQERELADLFDALKERNLSAALPRRKRHAAQRHHGRLLLEYLRRMSFNSLMLLVWSYAHEDMLTRTGSHETDEERGYLHDLMQAGAQVRLYTAIAIFRLTCRLLLNRLAGLPITRLSKLRRAARIDGVESYRRLIRASAALSQLHDDQITQRLIQLLRGTDLSL